MDIKVSEKAMGLRGSKKEPIIKTTFLGSTAGFKTAKKVKPIYTVTSVQEATSDYELADRIAKRYPKKKPRQILPRCWGWLPTLKEAKLSVKRNSGDMAECCYYSHVVIEEVFPGIPSMMFSDPDFQIWYEWKVDPKDPNRFRGKWLRCALPKWAKGICGWGI